MRVRRHAGDDRGQAVVLVIIVAAVLFVAVLSAAATMGRHAIERGRAQSVADAVALAAVIGGDSAARQVASANGAAILSLVFDQRDDAVSVVVRVGDATAVARATDAP